MRGNVKTIKITAKLSVLLAIITYIIAIKEEKGFCDLAWLPDTFLITVFGGAFASMLVVMICEISNYIQNRENAETYLFAHLYYLYGQLQVMVKNMDFYIDHIDQIHNDILTQLIANAEAEMNTIYYADYTPYKSDNLILAAKSKYNEELFPLIQKFLNDCNMLKLAVLTDEITIIKNESERNKLADCRTMPVLMKLTVQIQEPLKQLDELLTEIDMLCHGRYNWTQMRDDLIKGMPDNQTDRLEQFLKMK